MLTEIEASVDSRPENRITARELNASPTWSQQLKQAIRDVPELLHTLGLNCDELDDAPWLDARFPLRVPRSFVDRMRPGDPDDPLLRQVLPFHSEQAPVPGFVDDPLDERSQTPAPGLIHKYTGRALVITTQACAVHCRYCFRQHFPYAEHRMSQSDWRRALDYIAADNSIHEVLLSGGDPLSLGNDRLAQMLQDLETIPHIDTVRLHSRTPIVLPARLDSGFLKAFNQTRLQRVMVVHANHARELNDEVAEHLAPLRHQGWTLLNQTVLLKSVNDSEQALSGLSRRLFELGVMPYYLHLLDPVAGAARFDVPDDRAQALWRSIQARLPGYLVPKLAREVPGDAGKRWMNPSTDSQSR